MDRTFSKEARKELLESAFEFFNSAVDNFSDNPKVSIINFATSLELFLKARIINEHWALLFDKVDDVSIENFKNGSFVSVSANKLVSRINKLVGDEIGEKEEKAYAELFKHRNKIVHFYHMDLANDETKKEVCAKELIAWHYLHLRLKSWSRMRIGLTLSRVASVARKIRKVEDYGITIFETVKKEVDKQRQGGMLVRNCYLCNQPAKVQIETIERGDLFDLIRVKCLVCSSVARDVVVCCERCGERYFFNGSDEGCPKCGETIHDRLENFIAIDEADGLSRSVYCPNCDEEKIISVDDKYYVCSSCGNFSFDVSSCGWCGDCFIGYDSADTYFKGCEHCEGKQGVLEDD